MNEPAPKWMQFEALAVCSSTPISEARCKDSRVPLGNDVADTLKYSTYPNRCWHQTAAGYGTKGESFRPRAGFHAQRFPHFDSN